MYNRIMSDMRSVSGDAVVYSIVRFEGNVRVNERLLREVKLIPVRNGGYAAVAKLLGLSPTWCHTLRTAFSSNIRKGLVVVRATITLKVPKSNGKLCIYCGHCI